MVDREAVLIRLRALSLRTVANGCTEAEAMAAAEQLAKLLDRYQFALVDLVERQGEEIRQDDYRGRHVRIGDVMYVQVAIADYCDCRTWFDAKIGAEGRVVHTSKFLGHETDVAFAIYLMDLVDGAIRRAWREFAGVKTPISRRSFHIGITSRISDRLREMKAARNAHVDEASGRTGQSLVVSKAHAVTAAFDALGMRFPEIKVRKARKRKHDASAYLAGIAAGDAVNIVTGIGQDQRGKLG